MFCACLGNMCQKFFCPTEEQRQEERRLLTEERIDAQTRRESAENDVFNYVKVIIVWNGSNSIKIPSLARPWGGHNYTEATLADAIARQRFIHKDDGKELKYSFRLSGRFTRIGAKQESLDPAEVRIEMLAARKLEEMNHPTASAGNVAQVDF